MHYRIPVVKVLVEAGVRVGTGGTTVIFTAERVAELVTAHDAAPDHASLTQNLFFVGQVFYMVLAMLAILAALACAPGPIVQRCL